MIEGKGNRSDRDRDISMILGQGMVNIYHNGCTVSRELKEYILNKTNHMGIGRISV